MKAKKCKKHGDASLDGTGDTAVGEVFEIGRRQENMALCGVTLGLRITTIYEIEDVRIGYASYTNLNVTGKMGFWLCTTGKGWSRACFPDVFQ